MATVSTDDGNGWKSADAFVGLVACWMMMGKVGSYLSLESKVQLVARPQ